MELDEFPPQPASTKLTTAAQIVRATRPRRQVLTGRDLTVRSKDSTARVMMVITSMALGSLFTHCPECKLSTGSSEQPSERSGRNVVETQDVFADRSGLHRAHIGEIERGQTNVTLQTLKRLADTLGVTIGDLTKNL